MWIDDNWKPATDPTGNNRAFWVRECCGDPRRTDRYGGVHYHITCGLGDVAVKGDPFTDREEAERVCAAMNTNPTKPRDEGMTDG